VSKIGASDVLVSKLSEFLSENMGLYFPKKRWDELARKMSTVMMDFGFQDVEAFVRWLLSEPLTRKQVEVLASHLTVKETYFFRESQTYNALERIILPALIGSRRKTERTLRVWSAGCSTGEEAYSIAILLKELIPDIKEWSVTILATDINPRVLEAAKRGVYSEWSFRETPARIKERYFQKTADGNYLIDSAIKQMVVFSYLNLSEDSYPLLSSNTNAMDLIFCRNVLMYFAPESIRLAARRFRRCLVEGGFLIVSVVEASNLFASELDPLRFKDVTFYKKSSDHPKSGKVNISLLKLNEEAEVRRTVHEEIIFPKRRRRPSAMEGRIPKAVRQTLTPYEDALTLYQRGLYGEAEEKLVPLVSRDPGNLQSIMLFVRVLANQGKLSDAFHWCEKAIEANKLNPGLYYLRATILSERGKMEEAAASLNKVLYLDPDFVLAHFALGNLSLLNGRYVETRKHFKNTAQLLAKYRPEEALPEADGLTAGKLSEILRSINF